MRKFGAIMLIIVGLGLITVSVQPVVEMNQNLNSSLSEWEEELNKTDDVEDTSDAKEPLDSELIGMMTSDLFDKPLPIRVGITNAILDKGVGLDIAAGMLGDNDNSVLYGHREQVFWGLKNVEIGDEIHVQTRQSELTYEVIEIKVTSPDDDFIYREEDESVLTLVTCYPFIYMGPITSRYVVKAKIK